jgi:glutathione S-transferase
MITISAFKWVPEFAHGQVRDLRARWALEEAGIPYKTHLLELGDQDKPDYRTLQPFGQVPILQDGDFTLFESGAIVLHIGERSETLLPKDPLGRARATQWLIAALNSIEHRPIPRLVYPSPHAISPSACGKAPPDSAGTDGSPSPRV